MSGDVRTEVGARPDGFDPSREVLQYARMDLEYIRGLQSHVDEGGAITAKNISDLIGMVRWNAETLISAYSRDSDGNPKGGDGAAPSRSDDSAVAKPIAPPPSGDPS